MVGGVSAKGKNVVNQKYLAYMNAFQGSNKSKIAYMNAFQGDNKPKNASMNAMININSIFDPNLFSLKNGIYA